MPKQLLICFDCKATKPVVSVGGVRGVYRKPSCKCQGCGEDMGLFNNNINPPKKRDLKGWKKYQKLLGA